MASNWEQSHTKGNPFLQSDRKCRCEMEINLAADNAIHYTDGHKTPTSRRLIKTHSHTHTHTHTQREREREKQENHDFSLSNVARNRIEEIGSERARWLPSGDGLCWTTERAQVRRLIVPFFFLFLFFHHHHLLRLPLLLLLLLLLRFFKAPFRLWETL